MKYDQIIINTDGGARGNPGPAAIGITAESSGKLLFEISEYIGETTNNVAEYTAVLHSLHHLQEHQVVTDKLHFILDSELIVRQITGVYRVKEPRLQRLVTAVQKAITDLKNNHQIKSIEFSNVPRALNKRADQLVNDALNSHK